MSSGTNFQTDVTLTTGTNLLTVAAKDLSNNTRTNTYHVVISSGTNKSLTYDANGNLTSDGTNSYQWDVRNDLVKITYPGGASTEFAYDAMGRRVKIVEKSSAGSVTSTKQLIWEGSNIVEERNGSNTVTKRYFADGFQDVSSGTNYYYNRDHLGSVREIVGSDGSNIAARYNYDLYGRLTKVSGSVDADMLYADYYFHAASGLFLHWNVHMTRIKGVGLPGIQ